MNWTAFFNGFSELMVITLIFVLILYAVFSLNIKLLGSSKRDLRVNEAMGIYLSGIFISLALVFKPMLAALHSVLAAANLEGFVILSGFFYGKLIQLLLMAIGMYAILFGLCVFVFTQLTFSMNEFRDIANNNRRSAIILGGLLIAVFYAGSTLFDVIFSSIFENSSYDFIF